MICCKSIVHIELFILLIFVSLLWVFLFLLKKICFGQMAYCLVRASVWARDPLEFYSGSGNIVKMDPLTKKANKKKKKKLRWGLLP